MIEHEEQKEKPDTHGASASSPSRFCALAYSAQNFSSSRTVILLVLDDGQFRLRFSVHPHWRTIVHAEDLDYIESLLMDFLERAKLHPDELIKQLSCLNVGPLVTHKAGTCISDYPNVLELESWFVKL